MKKSMSLFFILAAVVASACGEKYAFPEGMTEFYSLSTGEALSSAKALKSDGIYGSYRPQEFESAQTVSFVRFNPAVYGFTVVNAEADEADSTSALCQRVGAIAGINGSYFNVQNLTNTTYVKDNGEVVGETFPSETFRVNGALFLGEGMDVAPVDTSATSWTAAGEPWWEAMASGPVLIDEGEPRIYREGIPKWKKFYAKRHPRSVVGIDTEGYVWLLVIDGRFKGDAEGMSVQELIELSQMLGLRDALNLDGGGSSTLWTKEGGVLNHPYDNKRFDHAGQRVVPNILAVTQK